ncbi:MAG: hypothetical protein QNJ34_23215 [Xenococcaceae cyanobacterium MO_188.B29]|nr:hypothetical protein [Xenococcaceae cyanobacterium MO_188.B29]
MLLQQSKYLVSLIALAIGLQPVIQQKSVSDFTTFLNPAIASQNLTDIQNNDVFNPHFSSNKLTDLREAIERIPYKNDLVRWDGANEQFIYQDDALKNDVYLIAETMLTEPAKVVGVLKAMPEKVRNKFTTNTNTIDSWSRTEPFDLLQGAITEYMMKHHGDLILKYGGSRITITKLVHRKLHLLLKAEKDQDPLGDTLRSFSILNDRQNQRILLFCADKSTTYIGHQVNLGHISSSSLTPFFKTLSIEVDQIERNPSKFKLVCDEGIYTLRSRVATALPLPDLYNSDVFGVKHPLNVLVTFSIIDDLNQSHRDRLVNFMRLGGYKYQEQKNVETINAFGSAFRRSDIFIPVAHGLDINSFDIGKEYSQQITFTKKIKIDRSRIVPIQITALFPLEGDLLSVQNGRKFFPGLLTFRRQNNLQSLVIINASCYSYENIYPWIDFYRQSLEFELQDDSSKSLESIRNLPYIIGSKSSFATDSIADIVKNFSYYIASIEVLALGGNPDDIFRELNEHDRSHEYFTVFDSWYRRTGNDPKINPFNPIYSNSPQYRENYTKPTMDIVVSYQKDGKTEILKF